jgi:uncharacterized protein (TIGR02001 family)
VAHERDIGLAAAALLACAAASTAGAQVRQSQLSGYLTVASDYRRYGLSQTDGHAAVQLGIDYEHARGWFAGAWASTVDFEAEETLENPRRAELDLYAGYDWERDDWGVTVTVTRYGYPDGPPYSDYDELSAGIRFRDRLFATVSRTSGFGSRDSAALSRELTLALPVPGGLELGATVGRFELEDVPASRYTYWNAGLSKSFGRFVVDLRFHDNTYEVTNYLGEPSPDEWVLSVSYGFLNR